MIEGSITGKPHHLVDRPEHGPTPPTWKPGRCRPRATGVNGWVINGEKMWTTACMPPPTPLFARSQGTGRRHHLFSVPAKRKASGRGISMDFNMPTDHLRHTRCSCRTTRWRGRPRPVAGAVLLTRTDPAVFLRRSTASRKIRPRAKPLAVAAETRRSSAPLVELATCRNVAAARPREIPGRKILRQGRCVLWPAGKEVADRGAWRHGLFPPQAVRTYRHHRRRITEGSEKSRSARWRISGHGRGEAVSG